MSDNELTEEQVIVASMWRNFTTYVVRQTPSEGFARISMSVLLEANAPTAWRVLVEAVPSVLEPGAAGNVESQWKSLGRHILAKAKDNNGFAIVESEIITHDGRPLLWMEANLRRIYPMSLANQLGREIITSLMIPQYTRQSAKFDVYR